MPLSFRLDDSLQNGLEKTETYNVYNKIYEFGVLSFLAYYLLLVMNFINIMFREEVCLLQIFVSILSV
mgnify:CR=1 FL=1